MVTTGTAKHFSLKIIFFCHVLLAKSSHILFTDIIQHLDVWFYFMESHALHLNKHDAILILFLKQVWCDTYQDPHYLLNSSVVRKWRWFHLKVSIISLAGQSIVSTCWVMAEPALSLLCPWGLSPGSSIIYWVPGCPQVPGSVIGIFRRWYQRMGPILLCSSFLSYCFFLFFYLDQYAEFCP